MGQLNSCLRKRHPLVSDLCEIAERARLRLMCDRSETVNTKRSTKLRPPGGGGRRGKGEGGGAPLIAE